MTEVLIQIVFGWPFLAASLLAAFAGLLLDRTWLLVAAALLIAPFSISFGSGLFAIPLFDFAAAWAVLERKTWLAWVLTIPSFVVGFWFIWVTIGR